MREYWAKGDVPLWGKRDWEMLPSGGGYPLLVNGNLEGLFEEKLNDFRTRGSKKEKEKSEKRGGTNNNPYTK